MTRVVVDEHIVATLQSTYSPVEICDASGNVIGTFTPKVDLAAIEAEDPVDYEELARRLREGTFISTAEMFARLGLP